MTKELTAAHISIATDFGDGQCFGEGYQKYTTSTSGAPGAPATTLAESTICMFLRSQPRGAFATAASMHSADVRHSAAAFVPAEPIPPKATYGCPVPFSNTRVISA